jgi:hypothetical protein
MSIALSIPDDDRNERNRFLSVYERFIDPLNAILVLGKAIAYSKFFGCESEHQGIVFALECMARKTPPLMLQEQYHLIFNKLSKKSDSMLADFNQLGGKHKIISRTPELAAVELSIGGNTQQFSLSWEEAQQEPFVYDGKEAEIVAALQAKKPLKLKPKYATPRARCQMMWARVVSDAVRAMCPRANQGVYTPEEMGDDELPVDTTIVDGEYEVREQSPTAEHTSAPVKQETAKSEPTKPVTSRAAGSTIGELFNLAYSVVGTSEAAIKDFFSPHLAKLKATSVAELTEDQARSLIAGLTAEIAAKQPADDIPFDVSPAKDSGADTSANDTDPATDLQVKQIRELIGTMEQDVPGTATKFKGLLLASGRNKIAELTIAEAVAMLVALRNKQMERFFKESLQPKN